MIGNLGEIDPTCLRTNPAEVSKLSHLARASAQCCVFSMLCFVLGKYVSVVTLKALSLFVFLNIVMGMAACFTVLIKVQTLGVINAAE